MGRTSGYDARIRPNFKGLSATFLVENAHTSLPTCQAYRHKAGTESVNTFMFKSVREEQLMLSLYRSFYIRNPLRICFFRLDELQFIKETQSL